MAERLHCIPWHSNSKRGNAGQFGRRGDDGILRRVGCGTRKNMEQTTMNVRVFTRFDALPATYDPLFVAAAEASFFLTRDWFTVLAGNILGPADELRLYGVEDSAGRPLILLPAYGPQRDGRHGSSRPLLALANFYTMSFAPIALAVTPGRSEALRALARHIASERPRWTRLEIGAMDPTAEDFALFAAALRESGFVTRTHSRGVNWYEPVDGRGYDDYLSARPSVLRNTLRRRARKLAREHDYRIDVVTGEEGLDAALADYQRIYAASWKDREQYPNFIPDLIRLCAATGTLLLGILSVDGTPTAGQFWIVHSRGTTIYKLAYDPAFERYSVGTILTAHLMEYTIETRNTPEVDFGLGDDAYKQQWMSDRREKWAITGYNPRTVAGGRAVLRDLGGHIYQSLIGRRA